MLGSKGRCSRQKAERDILEYVRPFCGGGVLKKAHTLLASKMADSILGRREQIQDGGGSILRRTGSTRDLVGHQGVGGGVLASGLPLVARRVRAKNFKMAGVLKDAGGRCWGHTEILAPKYTRWRALRAGHRGFTQGISGQHTVYWASGR